MKTKKGFTLSEVLITLTLIGIITTLTIPSLVANTDKSKKATTLKKAYNTISGAYSQALTENTSVTNLLDLTDELVKHLNVKYYYKPATSGSEGSEGTKAAKVATHGAEAGKDKETNWIVTEDGVGYQIQQRLANGICTKDKVAFVANKEYSYDYCYRIKIDINGPQKGDNHEAIVVRDDNNNITGITGEVFWVYATKQGLTAGNADWTFTAGEEYVTSAARILEAND